MKIETKEVLPLYIGCDVVYRLDVKFSREINTKNRIEFLAYLENCAYPGMFDSEDSKPKIDYIKLVLRKTDDVTIAESKEAYKIIHKCDPKDSESDTRDYISGCLDDDCCSELFLWALQNHFDLFGLIESGQAIDKAKL